MPRRLSPGVEIALAVCRCWEDSAKRRKKKMRTKQETRRTSPIGYVVALVIGISIALTGCAEQSAWKQVRTENTPAAYDRFITQFPNSAHAAEATATRNQMIEQEKERAKYERENAQRMANVAANWSKLKAGMTFNEVEGLIGPVKIKSMEMMQTYNKGKANPITIKLDCDQYTLEFDEYKRLTKCGRTN